jgi:hypothetical protein
VPVCARSHRIVEIRNCHAHRAVSFNWPTSIVAQVSPDEFETVTIEVRPSRGELTPGGSVMCRVTLVASQRCCVVDADIVCQLRYADGLDGCDDSDDNGDSGEQRRRRARARLTHAEARDELKGARGRELRAKHRFDTYGVGNASAFVTSICVLCSLRTQIP